MKTKLISIALFICVCGFESHPTHVLNAADDILGTYWNQEKDAKIRIFLAQNGKYSGKVEWMKEPNDANGKPKKDVNNPNKDLRDNDRLGLVILKYFEYNEKEKIWEDGTVYDPKNGKTYSGIIRFEASNKDKLYLRGYVAGMTWIGRTAEWSRVK